MMRSGAFALLFLVAGAVNAEAPEISMRPEGRMSTTSVSVALSPEITAIAVRPRLRPDAIGDDAPKIVVPTIDQRPELRPYSRPDLALGAQTQSQRRTEIGMFAFSPYAVANSLHPFVRPAAITQRAEEARAARLRGQICGDPSIQGEAIGRVSGRGRCGIDSAVRVRSVAGVALSPRPTIDCRTASALKTWVERGARPALADLGGISSLRVVSHYACRNRNSASSGRLSEHAFGHAIDIAGIGLQSGGEVTVLTDWNNGARGRALKQMWRKACGPFGTVLGPEANRFHRDHFHFDTARYRSGSYCR
jgi:hypothetical protein